MMAPSQTGNADVIPLTKFKTQDQQSSHVLIAYYIKHSVFTNEQYIPWLHI